MLEEAYVKGKGNLTYLGRIEVNHEENPKFDPNGQYLLIAIKHFLEWI